MLGLHHAATEADVRAAFRRLAMSSHPDKTADKSGHEMFVRIREARDLLLHL